MFSVMYLRANSFVSLSLMCEGQVIYPPGGYGGSEGEKAYNVHGVWSHAKQCLRTCLSFPFFPLHD